MAHGTATVYSPSGSSTAAAAGRPISRTTAPGKKKWKVDSGREDEPVLRREVLDVLDVVLGQVHVVEEKRSTDVLEAMPVRVSPCL
jgi:hypothetical protein